MSTINRARIGDLVRKPWVWILLVPIMLGSGLVLVKLVPSVEEGMEIPRGQGMIERFGYLADMAGNAGPKEEAGADGLTLPVRANQTAGLRSGTVGLGRKVISTAEMEIKVESVAEAADDLGRLAVSMGGFVQSSSYAADSGKKTAAMVLRIPAERFQEFLDAAGRLGTVMKKRLSGQDVTEEYVDLEARLRNWENQERQLNLIMSRAKTVGEVLAVQDKLGQVREEIERLQGRIKYIDYNVALATVNVDLYEGTKPAGASWLQRESSALARALYASCRLCWWRF